MKPNTAKKPRPLFLWISAFILIIGIPLVFSNKSQDPALFPRILALSSFLLISFLWLFKSDRNFFSPENLIKKPEYLVYFGFIIWGVISQLFAVNSIEGYFELCKSILFISTIWFTKHLLEKYKEGMQVIGILVLFAAIIASIIGFVEYFKEVAPLNVKYLPNEREVITLVTALMANKNQYAISLILFLPFIIHQIFHGKLKFQLLAVAATLLVLGMIFLLETRSVWMGTMVFFGIILIFGIFFPGKLGLSKKGYLYRSLITLLTIGVISLFVIFQIETENPYLQKVQSIAEYDSQKSSANFRIRIWDLTLEQIAENPITGVGTGAWNIEIKGEMAGMNLRKLEINWLRPHNDFLWVLSERGVPGFLLFITFFVLIYIRLFKKFLRSNQLADRSLYLLIIAGLSAYFVISLFSFPLERINHQMYIAIFCAIALFDDNQYLMNNKGSNNIYTFIPVLGALVFSTVYGFFTVKQDIHALRAQNAMKKNQWDKLITETNKAKNPFRTLDGTGTPLDYYLGMAYYGKKDIEKALNYYLNALEQSPNDIIIQNNIGQCYYNLKQYDKALYYLDKALEIVPRFTEALINKSSILYIKEDFHAAYKCLKLIPKKERNETINQNIKYLENMKIKQVRAEKERIKNETK